MKNGISGLAIRFVLISVLCFSIIVGCDSNSQVVTSLDGAFNWVAAWGGMNYDSIVDSVSDCNNDVIIAGVFNGDMDINPSSGKRILSAVDNDEDAFLAKFSSSGKLIWAKSWNVMPAGIAADSDNNVYLIGTFNKNVDFNPESTTIGLADPVGKVDGFLLKLNSKGEYIDVDTFGGTNNDSEVYPTGIGVNSTD